MTSERAAAYGRLMIVLDSFGADLLPEEQDQVRAAADALVFCHRLESDREAREALRLASDLVLRRVICGRELGAVVDRLLVELVGCGPDLHGVAKAA